ncbi:MAG: TonB-dependent receptor [Prevotellaceae bacterium]|jgi:outer membrane receptor protein involved in Fe transport|nr:TonB-dependent receptor [Prevotellaceae bacterium]
MRRNILVWLCACGGGVSVFAQPSVENETDTVRLYALDEVVVVSSVKETNPFRGLPASVSLFSASQVEGMKMISIKDLSSLVPNVYIPDYGSRMTVPVYVRGVGERSAGQTIGLYVDHMPYLDKSAFDFNFAGIQRIEVLRGPQGTLYGRNAMGGIIHIHTCSPLDYEQIRASATGGSYGLFRANVSVSRKLRQSLGISVNGYYDRNGGYFTNRHSGRREDRLEASGGRIRLDWQCSDRWKAQWMLNYDRTQQGAFPYGVYAPDGTVGEPDYNDPGSYDRQVAGGNFNLQYTDGRLLFNAVTACQYLDDDMYMDLDYTPSSRFTINQKQRLRTFTEEWTLKSGSPDGWQWLFGVYGFVSRLSTSTLTTMGTDGIREIMQPMFDRIHEENPRAPVMTVTDATIPIPGRFLTPGAGVAVFHQSTYNHLFTDGLSLTAGIRLDYERVEMDYDTNVGMNLDVRMGNRPAVPMHVDTTLQGSGRNSFREILPKVALKYEWHNGSYAYFTLAGGYKAGGYNIQMFADLAQQALREKYVPAEAPLNVHETVSYRPEYSWNYEAGYKGEWLEHALQGEITLFYADVRDIQLTKFVNSGQGRMLSNAGRVASKGVEWSLSARLSNELGLTAGYGYTHATFGKDDDGENGYAGKYVPYAPQQTLSISAVYRKSFRNRWIDRLLLHAHYHAAGKIYWTVDNDVTQDFYGLLNLKASATRGIFELALWTRNTLNTDYAAFYFESMGQSLGQKGKPLQAGIDLSVRF